MAQRYVKKFLVEIDVENIESLEEANAVLAMVSDGVFLKDECADECSAPFFKVEGNRFTFEEKDRKN